MTTFNITENAVVFDCRLSSENNAKAYDSVSGRCIDDLLQPSNEMLTCFAAEMRPKFTRQSPSEHEKELSDNSVKKAKISEFSNNRLLLEDRMDLESFNHPIDYRKTSPDLTVQQSLSSSVTEGQVTGNTEIESQSKANRTESDTPVNAKIWSDEDFLLKRCKISVQKETVIVSLLEGVAVGGHREVVFKCHLCRNGGRVWGSLTRLQHHLMTHCRASGKAAEDTEMPQRDDHARKNSFVFRPGDELSPNQSDVGTDITNGRSISCDDDQKAVGTTLLSNCKLKSGCLNLKIDENDIQNSSLQCSPSLSSVNLKTAIAGISDVKEQSFQLGHSWDAMKVSDDASLTNFANDVLKIQKSLDYDYVDNDRKGQGNSKHVCNNVHVHAGIEEQPTSQHHGMVNTEVVSSSNTERNKTKRKENALPNSVQTKKTGQQMSDFFTKSITNAQFAASDRIKDSRDSSDITVRDSNAVTLARNEADSSDELVSARFLSNPSMQLNSVRKKFQKFEGDNMRKKPEQNELPFKAYNHDLSWNRMLQTEGKPVTKSSPFAANASSLSSCNGALSKFDVFQPSTPQIPIGSSFDIPQIDTSSMIMPFNPLGTSPNFLQGLGEMMSSPQMMSSILSSPSHLALSDPLMYFAQLSNSLRAINSMTSHLPASSMTSHVSPSFMVQGDGNLRGSHGAAVVEGSDEKAEDLTIDGEAGWRQQMTASNCDYQDVKCSSLSRTHSRLDVVRKPIRRQNSCKTVVMPDGRTSYRCLYCNKDFCSMSDVNRHMDFHEDIRPYKCKYCSYFARTNSQLKVHMLRHQGIRGFHCQLCSYRGVTQSDLNRHSKSHIHRMKARNECHHCHEGFVSSSNLAQHCRDRHNLAL